MRRLLLFALVVLSLAAVLPASAQATAADCAPESFSALLSNAAEAVAQPGAALEDELTLWITVLQARRAVCAGLAFTGETSAVTGPFDLPAGDWIMTATFEEHGILNVDTLTDGCFLFLTRQSSILFSSGGGMNQSVIQSGEECRLLVTANTDAPWTLMFSPVE
jgi:hypothetical protein